MKQASCGIKMYLKILLVWENAMSKTNFFLDIAFFHTILFLFALKCFFSLDTVHVQFFTCADPEGVGAVGPDPPPKKKKNKKKIGFLSNTSPDFLKNHKATKSAFNVGPSLARQRNAI